MCFITNKGSSNAFGVRFEPSNHVAQYVEYKTFSGGGSSGRMLHMYMWTKDSKLFQNEAMYTKVVAYHIGSGNEVDGEKGWIVTLASESQVLEVCKLIMFYGIYNCQGTS